MHKGSTSKDLDHLFALLDKGFHISEIQVNVERIDKNHFVENVKVTLSDDSKVVINSSDPIFCEYAHHLHGIPDPYSETSRFTYIEDTNKYFEVQEKLFSILSGRVSEFLIDRRSLEPKFQNNSKKVKSWLSHWVETERSMKKDLTKLSRIFYDICCWLVKGSSEEFIILEKESISLSDIKSLMDKAKIHDLAICCSAFLFAPKLEKDREIAEYDPIIGLIIYDLKRRTVLSLNLNTIKQLQRIIKNLGRYGFCEIIENLLAKSIAKDGKFLSFLPLPIHFLNYTPLPWLIFACLYDGLKTQSKSIDGEVYRISLPEFFVFGCPSLPSKGPSFLFFPERQVAIVLLNFSEKGDSLDYELRFDRSLGQPLLHLDFQIYSANPLLNRRKIINHLPIDLEEVWKFNENLHIGFLVAGAYDVDFDKIIPQGLKGLDELLNEQPVAIYPLVIRSFIKPKQDWLEQHPAAMSVLKAMAENRPHQSDAKILVSLEEQGLLDEGSITILANIILTRKSRIESKKL